MGRNIVLGELVQRLQGVTGKLVTQSFDNRNIKGLKMQDILRLTWLIIASVKKAGRGSRW
jgi:hypothetical protein